MPMLLIRTLSAAVGEGASELSSREPEQPAIEDAQRLARSLRSARLRGVMRSDWLNQGIGENVAIPTLHWATSLDEANARRAASGLPTLDPSDDPAPDIAAQWSADSDTPNFDSTQFPPAFNGATASPLPGLVLSPLANALQWTCAGRLFTFALAATSIGCMLVDNEGYVTVRSFFFAALAPACLTLLAIAYINRTRGDAQLARAIFIGTLAGLAGAVVFNMVRLLFVFSPQLGLERFGLPHIPFFNLYPRIGAALLGQPVRQDSYPLQNHLIGWGYHIVRAGATGIMFAAAIGEFRAEIQAPSSRLPFRVQTALRGVLLTVTIQVLLLLSPYSQLFAVRLTPVLIFWILMAHVSFGLSISLFYAVASRTGRSNSRTF